MSASAKNRMEDEEEKIVKIARVTLAGKA